MKSKILGIAGAVIVCIIILSVVVIVWNRQKTVKLLEDTNIETISGVVLYLPGSWITVTEQEDIKRVVDTLQSMELKKRMPSEKDGGIPLEICYRNGEKIRFGFLSDEVTAENGCYRPDRDYCEDFRNFYFEFSGKYPEEHD